VTTKELRAAIRALEHRLERVQVEVREIKRGLKDLRGELARREAA
jgi:hypothetical protein